MDRLSIQQSFISSSSWHLFLLCLTNMEDVTDEKRINKAAIWMFVCNFCAMELSILGLLAIAYGELASASVPMLVLVPRTV